MDIVYQVVSAGGCLAACMLPEAAPYCTQQPKAHFADLQKGLNNAGSSRAHAST